MRQDNYVAFWRGISAQMVVVGHALNIFFPALFMLPQQGGRWVAADSGIFYIQNLGVVIFFLISGYIVTKTAMPKAASGAYDVLDFAIDRGTRILAPLIPAALLVYLLDHLFFTDGQVTAFQEIHLNLATLAANVTLLFNNPVLAVLSRLADMPMLDVTRIGTAQPFWTVVVEWWIYVAFGIIAIGWCVRRRFGILSLLVFGFAILYPWSLLLKGLALPLAWVFGSLYCLAEARIHAMPAKAALIVAATAAAMAAAALKLSGYNFYDPIFICMFSAMFLLGHRLLDSLVSDGQRKMPMLLNLWSDYSYSIYLLHFSVITYLAVLQPFGTSAGLMAAAAFLLSNAAAWLFWLAIERHHGRFRSYVHRLRGNSARFAGPQ